MAGALLMACGEPSAPPASSASVVPIVVLAGNQLWNPGFEQGTAGWLLKTDGLGFEIASQPVHSGRAAARVVLDWQPGQPHQPVQLSGPTQDISPTRFPDRLAGWYRVEHWENASEQTDLTLEVAVIVVGDPRTASMVSPDDPGRYPKLDNYQLRYQLAGVRKTPIATVNGRVKIVNSEPPPLGRWSHFELPLAADFQELWGSLPAGYRHLRVYFDARFDDKEPGAALRAEVIFDDLFVGFDDLPPS